jgi:pyruvate/2-oxoglutarate dehydrogenase complex dihydrolipoamide dehydrogenase (E3) component
MGSSYDLTIVGMGSGGMVAAGFAATLGIRVAAVERSRVGGDCLWTGCVPSKALLASAKVAHHMRTAEEYGIAAVEPDVDTAAVWDRIHRVQRKIADMEDNAERYEEMGVDVHFGQATLTGPNSLRVGDEELETRFILLCTGSRPVEPPIDGLAAAGYLTSETIWDIGDVPRAVVAARGGSTTVGMSQAFQRLGISTSVLQKGPGILPRDEPELVGLLVDKLRGEGLDLCFNVETARVTVEDGHKVVHGTQNGEERSWRGDEILVGAGRRPNVEGLGLEQLGIEVGRRGVKVDERMRTGVPSVYAVGDLAGRFLFTHSAGYEGVRAVRDMFFPGKGKVTDFVPWCTFTDPELSHAGMTRAEAEERFGPDDVEVWRKDLSHSDRARADGAEEGAILAVTHKKKLVGAHILAPAAGEMIHELALAIEQGLKLDDVASLIHVYPTVSTGIQQLAGDAAFESAQRYSFLVKRSKVRA